MNFSHHGGDPYVKKIQPKNEVFGPLRAQIWIFFFKPKKLLIISSRRLIWATFHLLKSILKIPKYRFYYRFFRAGTKCQNLTFGHVTQLIRGYISVILHFFWKWPERGQIDFCTFLTRRDARRVRRDPKILTDSEPPPGALLIIQLNPTLKINRPASRTPKPPSRKKMVSAPLRARFARDARDIFLKTFFRLTKFQVFTWSY